MSYHVDKDDGSKLTNACDDNMPKKPRAKNDNMANIFKIKKLLQRKLW